MYCGLYNVLWPVQWYIMCCPFTADYGDVRGFIQDGYQALGNREGDLAKVGHVTS